MNLQEYLNLSKEEFEFILENAELRELNILYNSLEFGNDMILAAKISVKYQQEFNRRLDNMKNKA